MGFPVLYCSELKNLQGRTGRSRSGEHSHWSDQRHTRTPYSRSGAGATHTHRALTQLCVCHPFPPSPVLLLLPPPSGTGLSGPGSPPWEGRLSPRPSVLMQSPRKARGRGWAGRSLLDDGGQLRAEVLAVEPLLKQNVHGVAHIVPARAEDRQPCCPHLGGFRAAPLRPGSAAVCSTRVSTP